MVGRFNLPENFYDRTAAQLLVEPEPQYLYSEFWLGAMRAQLNAPDSIGSFRYPVEGVGADYNVDADRLKLSNPLMNEVIAAKLDFNAAPGSTIRVNRPIYTDSTYTQASRKIADGASISTTAINFGSAQTHITVFRYGGPYDNTNSRVAPFAIEAFDANMGVHNVVKMVGAQLRRDCHKFLDAVNRDLLDLAATAVYPDGMTAVNDATSTGSFPMTLEQVNRSESVADTAHYPTFSDGFRLLVLTPTQVLQLKQDSNFKLQAQYHKEYNLLFPRSYQFSIGNLHIFKSATLNTTANSSSVNIHYGHLICPGALLAGMGRPFQVRDASDDNYGETKKVIWIGDLAFGLADNRLVLSVRSSA